ncbi:MAG: gluconeogenesis factor YvcK family protein [Acidimicrobiales bacterium]
MTRVVALGGGHGTAVTLRAARRYASEITAIVSVADDGGSTGRLREQLDLVALGDLRKCLVALATEGSVLARAFEHRFADGDLAGHAVGNVVLAGMVEAAGGLVAGIDETAALLSAAGRVLPATIDRVAMKALGARGEVNGQVAVSSSGRIERVSLVPPDCAAPDEAIAAIEKADQIVIGPGSLYTSVLAAAAVGRIARTIRCARAQRIYVCNLRPQIPETEGYTVADHVAALERHGIAVDVVLWDPSTGMDVGETARPVIARPLAGPSPLVHDPDRLAAALSELLVSGRGFGHRADRAGIGGVEPRGGVRRGTEKGSGRTKDEPHARSRADVARPHLERATRSDAE